MIKIVFYIKIRYKRKEIMEYKDILNLPYKPVCDCLVSQDWAKKTYDERVNIIKDGGYRDILYMYCEESAGDMYEKEKEFSHLMYYVQDICYLPCLYEPLTETNSGRQFLNISFPEFEGPRFEHYGTSREHLGREYKSIPELVCNTLEEAGYLWTKVGTYSPQSAFRIFRCIHSCKSPDEAQNFSETLGMTKNMLTSNIFPFFPGTRFRGRTQIFEEQLNPRFLIILPEETADKFSEVSEAVLEEYYTSLNNIVSATLWEQLLQAKSDVALINQCDAQGIDWRKWDRVLDVPPYLHADKEQSKSFREFISNMSAVQKNPTVDDTLGEWLKNASFLDKVNMFNTNPITWRNFYNGDIGEHESDLFVSYPIITQFELDDSFRQNAWKQYPKIQCGLYLTAQMFIDGIRYRQLNKDNIKRAEHNFAVQYWLYGQEGIRKLTDILGGAEQWKFVYDKPSDFEKIPVRPKPMTIDEWKPEYKSVQDLETWQWDNRWWPFIESYCKWEQYMARERMKQSIAEAEARARREIGE